MRPLPNFMFQALFFGGIAVLIAGGIQYQVSRKQRTSFMHQPYIEDSATGNSTRYRVLVGKDDTAGESFTVEMLIRPQAYGVIRGKPGSEAAHYHINQEEHIRVKQGRLGYFIGHQSHVRAADTGEEVTIKAGEAHTLFNAGGGVNGSDLLLEVTFTPARHGEQLFETLAGLGYDYESPLAVSPIQKWLTLNTAEVVLTDIQPATWNFIQDVLVLMAKKIGYKPFYPEYRTKRQSALNQEEEEDEEEEEEEKE